jgi:hypothetical protein
MPRRRYEDDEDDYQEDDSDDRPRRRKTGNAVPVALIAGLVAVVLLGCGGLLAGYFVFARAMSKPKSPPPVVVPAPPPMTTTAPIDPPPSQALATVITVRRLGITDGKPRLEVLYRFDQPTALFDQFDLAFEIEGRTQLESGTARVPIRGAPPGETQTVQVEREVGFVDLASARMKVWVEKRTTPARPADRVSNVFRL